MTCRRLLVLVVALSSFALSTCNVGDTPISYRSKVLDTAQEGCPPDEQLESTRAEIRRDVHRILQRYLGKSVSTSGDRRIVTVKKCNWKHSI